MRLASVPHLLAAGLILVAAGCGPAETPSPTNLADAREQAATRGVPLLIDFYTDW